MFFRILKNDLKRKKTINIILFLFIILTTIFASSGINNVISVMNGTDYYLDKAGIGDYVVIMTGGDDSAKALEEMLNNEKSVKSYRTENLIFGAEDNVTAEDGSALECKNTTIFQSIEESKITFFDRENEPITSIEPGHIYASGGFMERNGLEKGDMIRIKHSGTEVSFFLEGTAKDALLGSDFMGNTRFILNDSDMQKFLENEMIVQQYSGSITYIDTDDIQSLKASMSKISNVIFDGPRSMIETCYVMELIVAFVMLILSVCLIIVSMVILKFSITFTITEEFREIGVMKAIGLSNRKIRSLYIVKYFMMAVIGAAIGFFPSISFSKLMLDSVSKKMVLGNDNAVLINLLSSLLVVLVIVLFAYLCTGKVKKSSPADAIRSGQTGERYKNKSVLRIHKSPFGNAFFMALNDILSSPKQFLSIIISFSLCTLFVLILVNTTATMKSPNLISLFGTKSDLYITDVSKIMKSMSATKEDMQEKLRKMAEELGEEEMPAELCIELQFKYPITFEGNEYQFTCQQGMNTEITDYEYLEGVIPQNEKEIAITPQISRLIGAEIGDTITVHYGEKELDCIVTAYFQTMNQLGEIIRLHEDAPTDFSYLSSAMSFQIDFTDHPSEKEIELRKERIKELYHNNKVMNATEYCIDCTSVADTLESVQLLLLGITLVVVILVTILTERSFIANEKSQIAILKAIGFKDRSVIKWQVYRFGLTALIAVVLAAALSIPMTKLCITPIFGMMGATEVNYKIDPLQIFLIYPGIVLVMTIFITWITALYTKTITSNDTANVE